ncbi:MAG: transposase [Chloroflexi bacterium]|nr:transposase [Chloroflexota bacterium]
MAKVTKANAEMVAAAIRTIFAQPNAEAVNAQFDRIVDTLEPQFPQVAAMLLDARVDLLAFTPFRSSIGARSGAPTPSSACTGRSSAAPTLWACSPTTPPSARLVSAVIVEQHDEWAVAERRYLSETSMARLRQTAAPQLSAATGKRKRLAS